MNKIMDNYRRKIFRYDPIISCFIPDCKNMVMTAPRKHFFRVPCKNQAEWCAAVKRRVAKGPLYICEDHLNLEDDLANYNMWRCKNVTARLKPQVPDRLRNLFSPCVTIDNDKGIQVKPCTKSASTSTSTSASISTRSLIPQVQFLAEDLNSEEQTSQAGSTTEFICTETETGSREAVQHLVGREFILNLIHNKPSEYLGLPKQYFWFIEFFHKQCNIPASHIIITLYKIKTNDSFAKISDLFQISLTSIWSFFFKVVSALFSFFQQFVYWPTEMEIKRKLPRCFRVNQQYTNTQAIIDCFEIEIEKPKDPIQQSLTWSQYKNCNTIKYLVSTTPDGFINFISSGYGGRISDIKLVEQSGFLDIIPENCYILADRGFKHLETLLSGKSSKVLRPPSVSKDTKMTKSEVIQSKVLASLRVHVERVIRRLRLYRILKPHSVVNNKLVSSLDNIVITACGLINFQLPILKNY